MISRFHAYGKHQKEATALQGGGAGGLRRCVETAEIVFLLSITALFLLSLISSPVAGASTPVGTVISNTATATFTPGPFASPLQTQSNQVSLTTTPWCTTATIEFLQYAPTAPGAQLVNVSPAAYSANGSTSGPFTVMGPPVPVGSAALDLTKPVPLVTATQYHEGEPIFIRLTDPDQNVNPAAADTVVVTIKDDKTGDTEVLRLTETGPSTGIFAGYIMTTAQQGASSDGVLNVAAGSSASISYFDACDAAHSTTTEKTAALIDPYGIVFNSSTGAPVDGVQVTLVNVATGGPATVYGDDGVSIFPATVTSGGTVQDSSGRSYSFPSGGYRFPFIQPGQYRLYTLPPAGYRAPSTVQDATLQALPGGPFALADPGSRGEDFTINPGPTIHIDIPVDPVVSQLYVTKTAGKDRASAGDFVPYKLTVENTSATNAVAAVTVTDTLPVGFRYRKGSARLNGASTADPAISTDGRTVTFSIGDLASSATAQIDFVAEVGVGAALGNAVNTAIAGNAAGVVSNTAFASVLVTEDLFKSVTTIVGRVFVDGCGNAGEAEPNGLAGVRIYLEDGTYVVTDKKGMYHFEAVKPGTHVVQLDTESVPERYEIVQCEENTRFAGNAFSQFVDVQGGSLWRADFHLGLREKHLGEVGIELRTRIEKSKDDGSVGAAATGKDIIQYLIPVHVGGVPGKNGRLIVFLPEGAAYLRGTSLLNGAAVDDPQSSEGTVTYRIDDLPAGWEGTLRFNAEIAVTGKEGNLDTRAVLVFDSPSARDERTPVVTNSIVRRQVTDQRPFPDMVLHPKFASGSPELSSDDKKSLDRIVNDLRKVMITHITIIGHTDNVKIKAYLRAKYPDNYALSYERAASVGDYLASALKLSPDQVSYDGKGPDEPVASNATEKGRAKNRRVELKVETVKAQARSELVSEVDRSGMKAVATIGLRPGEERRPEDDPHDPVLDKDAMPDFYSTAWLDKAEPGFAWLWPGDEDRPAIPAVTIAVKHDPDKTVKLFLNGREVEAVYLDNTVKSPNGTVAVSLWRGVSIVEGINRFETVLYDAGGTETARIAHAVHYAGSPVKAELVPAKSRLTADGKTPSVIAVRLTDKDGQPARKGLLGEYSIDPPYLPRQRAENLKTNPLNESKSDRLKYQVGEDGIALIELQPTMQTGEAVVRLPMPAGAQEVRAWIKPEKRDWVLVGLAEGTVGYNTVTGNMQSLGAAGGDENYYEDNRVAFYAKGMIKGEWLLTLAYDSAKTANNGQPGLYQTIDPNKYYLLYGDGTQQQYDASSSKKIYVKLERDQAYALFGDYTTGLTVTELSRYDRSMTGFKSEMKGKNFEYNVFASQNNQAFVKDEIQGDGTSGLYHLSKKNILLNSETVTIQVRDRFRSEVIVSSQQLTRFLDYSIDYDSGTIWFKSPVYSRDENFNPVYIVVDYEVNDSSSLDTTYGGRGAVKLADGRVVVGATHIHEGRTDGGGDLEGTDATVDLGGGTKLKAEAATTKVDQTGTTTEGSAYLAEVQHHSDTTDAKVYAREQDTGFGLGQQNGSETGTRKVGGDVSYRLGKPWTVGGEAYRQDTLATGARSDMAEVRGRYAAQQYDMLAGVRHAEDILGDTEGTLVSNQVFAGASYKVTDRTTVRAEHDQSVGSNSDINYPTRTTLGVDHKLNDTATLFAAQEFTYGSGEDTTTSRVGIKASPWAGGQVGQTVEQQETENGLRLFSTTGLKQTWQITRQWSVDGGLDRSSTIRRTSPDVTVNPNVPAASGSTEDFTAVNFGAGYRQEHWSWTTRIERRWAESENKVSGFMGANGDVREGLALAAGLQAFETQEATGTAQTNGDLRLALAYRPPVTRYVILDRLDFLREKQSGVDIPYDNWRVVNNYVMNIKLESRYQVSLQYGSKYVQEVIEANDYRGYTDLAGLEGRYDLTKRWDLGGRGLVLHSWDIGQSLYGTGFSTGFNAGKNVWVTVGYNFSGFQDRDFSKSDFTSQGPFVKLRLKFDQVSVREAVRWFAGQ